MNHLSHSLAEKCQKIRLIVFDVDGVLTDGTLVYGATGETLKHFNVKDGVGMKLLKHFNISAAVISAKDSLPLTRRMQDLGIEHFYPGSKDKWQVLSKLLDELQLVPEQVCFVGDDVIDLKVMTRVGLSIAPNDAFWMVRERADLVTKAKGGRGVAREVADIVLGATMPLEQAYIKAMLPEFEG